MIYSSIARLAADFRSDVPLVTITQLWFDVNIWNIVVGNNFINVEMANSLEKNFRPLKPPSLSCLNAAHAIDVPENYPFLLNMLLPVFIYLLFTLRSVQKKSLQSFRKKCVFSQLFDSRAQCLVSNRNSASMFSMFNLMSVCSYLLNVGCVFLWIQCTWECRHCCGFSRAVISGNCFSIGNSFDVTRGKLLLETVCSVLSSPFQCFRCFQ